MSQSAKGRLARGRVLLAAKQMAATAGGGPQGEKSTDADEGSTKRGRKKPASPGEFHSEDRLGRQLQAERGEQLAVNESASELSDFLFHNSISSIFDWPGSLEYCGPGLDDSVRLLTHLIESRSVGEGKLQFCPRDQRNGEAHDFIQSWIERAAESEDASFALAWHVEGEHDLHFEYRGFDTATAAVWALSRVVIDDISAYVDFMLPDGKWTRRLPKAAFPPK